MTQYITTRSFPAAIAGRVEDLIPGFCRSVKIATLDDGMAIATAHKNEIDRVRRAIRCARLEAEANAALARSSALVAASRVARGE